MPNRPNTRELLIEKAWARSIPEPNTGCWLWMGTLNQAGYAQAQMKGSKTRVLTRHLTDAKPDEVVRHRCDTRCCVNPDHLVLGSRADNMADMRLRRRGHRKLRAWQIQEILDSSEDWRVLAAKYNVQRRQIWAIKTGRSWLDPVYGLRR